MICPPNSNSIRIVCTSRYPKLRGLATRNSFQLDKGLSYIETLYTPLKDLAVLSHIEIQEPRMVVTLGLKGHSRFAGNQGDELVFNEGYTTITAFNSSIGERQYEANKSIMQLRFSMSKKWLDRYFGEDKSTQLFNKSGIQLLSYQPISPSGIDGCATVIDVQCIERSKTDIHAWPGHVAIGCGIKPSMRRKIGGFRAI